DIDAPTRDRLVDRLAAFQQEGVGGEVIQPFPVELIGGANRDLVHFAEHVEQHHGAVVHAAQGSRVARRHGVEPTAATWPAGNSAVFLAGAADAFADAVAAVVEL